MNERILAALAKRQAKAALFVCGMRVDSADGRELIASWDRAGHIIGNHSYSHLYFNGSGTADDVTLAAFAQNALRATRISPGCSGIPFSRMGTPWRNGTGCGPS